MVTQFQNARLDLASTAPSAATAPWGVVSPGSGRWNSAKWRATAKSTKATTSLGTASAGKSTATTLQALGNQLGELGRTDEAIPMLERALEIRREAKADPYLRASSAYTLGKLREQVGERTEGIALVREARELLTEIQPRHAKFLAEVDAWLAEHGAAPEG